MAIVERLSDPTLREIYLTALAAGLGVVVMCGVLSVLVVVKRLGFVGQGVSHSAFGGIGVAALLAALGVGGADGGVMQFGVVTVFCIAAALGMAAVSDRRTLSVDTAIGLFLVGSMALGAILVQEARTIAGGRTSAVASWEAILFGSILYSTGGDALVAWGIALGVLLVVWLVRRPLLFWGFDEETSRAFGVPARAMKTALMVVLALAVVVAMRLAGVVLATALLVIPGATALKLSSRLWPVVGLSVGTGVLGLVGGLVLSLQLDWQPGPSVVAGMATLFLAAAGWERVRGRRTHTPAGNAPAAANYP